MKASHHIVSRTNSRAEMFTTELGFAAYQGERNKIQNALAQGIDWNDEAEYLLSSAFFGHQWDIARDILKGGMPVTESVYTAIYHWGDHSLFNELPPRPDILEPLKLGTQKYNFFNAIIAGDTTEVKNLFKPEWIHAHTDVLADRVSRQPLHLAARSCHYDLLDFFLKAKADVNALTSDGQSALTLVARCPSVENKLRRECFKLLRQHGGALTPQVAGWLENWRLSRGGWMSQ